MGSEYALSVFRGVLINSGLVHPIANSARREYSTWGTGVMLEVVAGKDIPGCQNEVLGVYVRPVASARRSRYRSQSSTAG